MQAYTYKEYGAPEVLHIIELPTPTPKADEVLIKVKATTVSAGDWRARSMTMPAGMGLIGRLVFGIFGPRKGILGTELSGVIEAVGANVTNFRPGDAVIAFPGGGFGAHAEFITMPATGKLVPKPDTLRFEEAAAIPFGATTAYDFLINKAKLQSGEKVLVNGASGATGSACVQIAKHFGAEVTAVCSAANADLVRSLGADHVIDYRAKDFTADGPCYDMVVDTVGNAPWHRTRHALVPKGRMVMIAGSASDMLFGAIKARLRGKQLIGGVASESGEILGKVVELAAQGHYKPVIDRCYDFSHMVDAHRHVDTGHKKGNVVVTVGAPN
ncbi:NAD(P)-dependent alcohol dehydrogenase [Yoonia sediminilitoris]|uniref:NADPH:quinone reductase-like Zn-dependent oxidoreductase n=1 Tax=Yoonia sediminilitoris TaxID=1286148 RepID=A0A2T6KEY4_9RHOB|nr:NAD(P)-dependent alcohol dehydrogenase [Yoonia sediminilitoris]PUB13678.1 NADPH:quinone reductase-like Zn-dependent oxidoreductase [Yoonia sediminilitoris]RCW94848.1 NADPH:quinone reductase-like Zn-dependent oxidoreductase [Yoonia sediminilitoris]